MPRNRSILTCICTAVACSALTSAQASDGRHLNILLRTPDGSSPAGAIVRVLSERGDMISAVEERNGYAADGIGTKLIIQVRHPTFGDVTVYGVAPRDAHWVAVSYVSPGTARLILPSTGPNKSTSNQQATIPVGACPPSVNDCCFPGNGTPGCNDVDCCNAVCSVDPFCCDTAWDSICAGEAVDLCGDLCGGGGGPCGPGAGDCCTADGTPGCDDVDCCNAICAIDPFCCDTAWDGICVSEAQAEPLCDQGVCGGGNACNGCELVCPDSLPENEPCGSDTNGGCNSIPPIFTNAACGETWCGNSWAAGGTRDTDWYLVNHGGGTLSATVTSEFPAVCFIVDGIGACAPAIAGQTGCSDACAPIADASAILPAGQYVVFVAPGDCAGGGFFDGFPCDSCNDYYVSITCTPPQGCDDDSDCTPPLVCINGFCGTPPPVVCGPGAGDCCVADGTPGCDDVDCCEAICAADPFCCDVAWDGLCSGAAQGNPLCDQGACAGGGVCGNPASGDCCVADGTPGCDDQDCCDAVCGIDPFCCDTAWDSICQDEACTNFPNLCDCCGGGGSNCCVPNGGLGCDDPDCQAAVCAVDPFCCDTSWDSICAGEAADLCGDLCGGGGCNIPACGPGAGDCCTADGTPGCDDVDCCCAVCTLDPFCCDTAWDSICVGEAQAEPLCDQGACGGGGPCGPPNPQDCCVPNGGPGCNDADCCNLVCGIDPFCCDTAWDGICAGEAQDLCGDLCGGGGCPPSANDCCQPGDGTPGCSDPECCNAVCAIDPFCCDTAWDGICAGEAAQLCAICQGEPCELPCPPGSLAEPEPCGADTNGGCNVIPPVFTPAACGQTWCGTTWATGGTRDTDWYLVNHTGGPLNGTVSSEIPTVCFIVDGIGACAPAVVGTIGCGDDCANLVVASADLPAGQYVVFVAPGDCGGGGVFDGLPCGGAQGNDYVLTISCPGPCDDNNPCPPGQICVNGTCIVPPPANDDCDNATALNVPAGGQVVIAGTNVNATNEGAPACPGGLPQVGPGVWYSVIGNGHSITATTCGGAGFDTMLTVFCGDCPEAPASNCCVPNGGLGCDDPDCEATVCAADPFCCDTAWDGICADEAAQFCGDLCSVGGGALCVVGNDDFCGLQSSVTWCAKAGSKYLILVHGFGGATGPFNLTVSDNNVDCVPTVDCPLSCLQVISETTECIGATGTFNYHVVAINTCTNSPITFDFVGEGGRAGQQMCFTVQLYDNFGVLCCEATLCTNVPDCEPGGQPCDLDGDHNIGVTDMLILLSDWGTNPGGPPDYDADGTVGVTDFLHLLSNWGPCP